MLNTSSHEDQNTETVFILFYIYILILGGGEFQE